MRRRRKTRGVASNTPLSGAANEAERSVTKDTGQAVRKSSPSQGDRYGETLVSDSARAHFGDVINHNHFHETQKQKEDREKDKEKRYKILHDSLRFSRMDARHHNIAAALPSTCEWVFEHQQFVAWKDLDRIQEHNGFLWIKGKPGSGKSTIMKAVLAWAKRKMAQHLVLSYFFNARSSNQLEKSSLGMYRSLPYQLLEAHSPGRLMFGQTFDAKENKGIVEDWTETELQNFLIEVTSTGACPPLIFLIDALDEGSDDDVRRMVQYLERLAKRTVTRPGALQICFSSRHYPQISIGKSLSLVLEAQNGHKRDIQAYIDSELLSSDSDLMHDIRLRLWQKSNGVFLWVVLIVVMLNKAFDSGKNSATMLKILEEIPSGLHDVFTHLLTRDAEDLEECITLLEWVLFARRSLTPIELYYAVSLHRESDCDRLPSTERTTKFLLNCSRGLVELTNEKAPTVQFVHETVRDYLLGETPLKLWRSNWCNSRLSITRLQPDDCHANIAKRCLSYLLSIDPDALPIEKGWKGLQRWPIGDYSAKYWWQHLHEIIDPCDDELLDLATQLLWYDNAKGLKIWTQFHNVLSGIDVLANSEDLYPPLHYAAATGIGELVRRILRLGADVNAQKRGVPLFALSVASDHGHDEIVQILIDAKANINAGVGYQKLGVRLGNPLQKASEAGHEKVVRTLISAHADVNPEREYLLSESPLLLASRNGHEEVVRILLDAKADVNAKSGSSHLTALQEAQRRYGYSRGATQILQAAQENKFSRQ